MIIKLLAVAAGAILLPVGLIALATTGLKGALSGPAADCLPTGQPSAPVAGFDTEQIDNAAIIIAVGKQQGVPPQGWVVAVATAMQESGLRNLNHGDRDSLGLFQQRPSQNWGSPEQVTDPTYAASRFYERLVTVPDWQGLPVTEAAQAVQASRFPDAYARREPDARRLVNHLAGVGCTPSPPGQAPGGVGGWVAPTTGRCTSGFGPRGGEFHAGQDIAAPVGTPIGAASAGTVIDSGPAQGFGLWVRIRHADGTITTYGHNHRNHVTAGQNVHTGQVIAEVGNRGQSTGPHLHYAITNPAGQNLDPAAFHAERGVRLCG